MVHQDWMSRLKVYLDPFQRSGNIDAWSDRRILAGFEWLEEIKAALKNARTSILLVGPGFLASPFVIEEELPFLLQNTRVFPLIVGYCPYYQSPLGRYQAFNDPDQPLESLETPKQNKVLNDLAVSINEAFKT
jgi:hypothetical protein